MSRFRGKFDELKAVVERTGFDGEWHEHANNHHQFRADNGAVLNWWDTKKKTLQIQGSDEAKVEFQAAFEAAAADSNHQPVALKPYEKKSGRKIFVVHGLDHQAREQLERILMILDLEPMVIQNTGGAGLTLVEALEGEIGRDFQSDFGIVLMTPDDMGYSKVQGETEVQPRARQNVILELGMLLSSLTRKRVAVLVKGHLELPSDVAGLIYIHFNDHVREVVPKLVDRLQAAGFSLDPAKISRAQS